MLSGDMEMKQNKSLPPEQQIVTANPDIVTVCGTFTFFLIFNLNILLYPLSFVTDSEYKIQYHTSAVVQNCTVRFQSYWFETAKYITYVLHILFQSRYFSKKLTDFLSLTLPY